MNHHNASNFGNAGHRQMNQQARYYTVNQGVEICMPTNHENLAENHLYTGPFSPFIDSNADGLRPMIMQSDRTPSSSDARDENALGRRQSVMSQPFTSQLSGDFSLDASGSWANEEGNFEDQTVAVPPIHHSRVKPTYQNNTTGQENTEANDYKNHRANTNANGALDPADAKTWACPWYKLDPWTHYRCLERSKMKRFTDVKQHILRRHSVQLPYHCERCWDEWNSREAWESHQQQGQCSGIPEADKLRPNEILILRSGPRGQDEERKWYWIWETFFEGHRRPRSPYVEQGIGEPIALLQSRANPALVAGLPSLLLSHNIMVDDRTISQLQNGINHMVFNPSPTPRRFRLIPDHGDHGDGAGAGELDPHLLEGGHTTPQLEAEMQIPDFSVEPFFGIPSLDDDAAMQILGNLEYTASEMAEITAHVGDVDISGMGDGENGGDDLGLEP